MKILYAASNNLNAKVQLSRFLRAMNGTKHQIKVAAYIKSSPKNTNIDWTLNALLNVYKSNSLSLDSDNLRIYFDQVKAFAPDLVISDLEYFTSIVANELNLHLWQCSSSIINFALTKQEKYNLGLFKNFAHAVNKSSVNTQRMINIIENSNRNFLYSHFGDMDSPPAINSKFEWVRPYHQLAKDSIPCHHFLTAAVFNNDKKLLNTLKKYLDCVVFIDQNYESYPNLLMKDIEIENEYYCNLKNSDFFACQGQVSFLADAFYNGKYSLVYPNYKDIESIINSQMTQQFKTGSIMTYTTNIDNNINQLIFPVYSEKIKFLHEHIREL